MFTVSSEAMSSLTAETRHQWECLPSNQSETVCLMPFLYRFIVIQFYTGVHTNEWNVRNKHKITPYWFFSTLPTSEEVQGRRVANQKSRRPAPRACKQYKQSCHDNLAILRIFNDSVCFMCAFWKYLRSSIKFLLRKLLMQLWNCKKKKQTQLCRHADARHFGLTLLSHRISALFFTTGC